MTELFIFSLGLVIGCSLSYVFFKTGVKSNLETFNYFHSLESPEDKKLLNSNEYDPEMDTRLNEQNYDWNDYPYTNEYNDQDGQREIIGHIDPETDEKN